MRSLLFLSIVTISLMIQSSTVAGQDVAADQVSGERKNVDEDLPQRAILITGASTGIGRKTAEVFAVKGFHVYAGARKDKDIEALNAIENIQAIRLDVTVPADIEAAVQTVQDGGLGLYGLINNAGVAVVAPLIEVTDDDLAFQMDVNVTGPVRITRAFAPMIIESGGRISTTGSISGVVCWNLGGPYSMSKHAIEAFSDVLASEMQPFGVHVSVVDPGNYRSNIMMNTKQRLIDNGYTSEDSLYKQHMDMLLRAPMDRGQFKEPDDVAAAFVHAMTDDKPKRRYMVVPNQMEANMTVRAALKRAVELNEHHDYSLNREALIEMLDDLLQESNSNK